MAKVIWYRLKKSYTGAPESKVLVYNSYGDIWYSAPKGKGGNRVSNPDPTYWEAMYTPVGEIPKDDIKVGDWVEVLREDSCYYNSEKCPQEVAKINPKASLPYELRFSNGTTNTYAKVRKVANPIKTLKIAGYEPALKTGAVEFGCQKFTLAEVQTMERLIINGEIKGKVSIQGVQITPGVISMIKNAIVNYKR